MKGKFVEGDQLPVTASGAEKALDLILPSTLSSKYDVEKLSTSGLDPLHDGYQITWVNNFKLNLKPGKTKKNTKVYYEIQFEKPDVTNLHLFIYDGSAISMLASSDWATTTDGKVALRLKGDDPAVGWGSG